jgi:predicted GIY-YIG superfamily endonuclease
VKKSGKKTWSMYILKCGDGTLYTGITNDMELRFQMHKSGVASKYTRSRLPVKIVHRESCRGRVDALKKEYAVKQLSRTEKEDYIRRPWKIKK